MPWGGGKGEEFSTQAKTGERVPGDMRRRRKPHFGVNLEKLKGGARLRRSCLGRSWREGRQREVAQSCPPLRDPMDCSLPGSSVHGIFQARVLEWAAITFSGGRVRGKRGTLSAPERGVDFPPEEEELVVSGEQGVPYVRTSLVPRAQRSGLFLRPTKSA